MKPEGPLRHFILAFLLAMVGYVICYQLIEHQRTRKGPWSVTFTTGTNGAPSIMINQPKLGITNVQISFADESLPPTHSAQTLIFRQPKPVPYDLPFGKCVFMDTTFLPGTLTFDMFGHEVELLPRVLVIDQREHRWESGRYIAVPHSAPPVNKGP